MKKLIVVAIVVIGFFPRFLLAQETEAIRQALQSNYTVLSIYQKGSFARAVVREPDGKEVKIYLKKDLDGEWKIFPEKDRPVDVFKETEKQDIADDLEEDRD